jgi:hypothetical protein
MKKNFLISLITFFLIFLISQRAIAGIEHNLSGWAWSENVGWISFNCLNQNSCQTVNYGVNLDPQTKVFSGYAWSENVGWITFNESELSGCPQAPCRAWLGQDNKVYGWARALAYGGGWDGWIKLNGTNYGISFNPSTREFEGFAWSDMVIGWISFNCKNQNVCSTSNYKVYLITQPPSGPSVSNLQESFTYCGIQPGVGMMNLSWKYNDSQGKSQIAYSLEVQQLIGGSWQTKVLCESISQSVPSGGQGTSAVYIKSNPTSNLCDLPSYVGDIEYGKSTRWRVKVENEDRIWSDWSEWKTITVADHAYPWVDFSWDPQMPIINQPVQFTNKSECYNSSGATTPCSSFFWTFEGGNPASSNLENPTTTFTSWGSHQVTLKVTDSSGFWCDRSKSISTGYPLPFWREIPPFYYLEKFFASLFFTISKIKFF